MPNPTLLNAAGYGSILISVMHAATANQFMPLRQYQELPRIAYTRSTVGWFQGSAYLILTGLLNISWSQNPESLEQPLNRAIAAMLVLIAWGSSAWYLRRGVTADGVLTAFAGVFQAWAALL